MFYSNQKYTNRYSDQYWFEKVTTTTYKFVMEGNSLKYGRCGGKDGAADIDFSDLGMIDPSGGPYICLGTNIDGKRIVKITSTDEGYLMETSE